MFKKKTSETFYCFSPPIMLATFVIELVYIVYVLYKYKLGKVTKLVAATLLSLAIFQLAEYFVCGGIGVDSAGWSRVGFVTITLLPPLGLHTIYKIAGKPWNNLVGAAYGMALAWVLSFTFNPKLFTDNGCSGNYVIYHLAPNLSFLYGSYYYLLLFIGIIVALKIANKLKPSQKNVKQALMIYISGYLAFILPTIAALMVKPETMRGIPSIMCGFAVIFATVTTFLVVPRVVRFRNKNPKDKQ